MTSAAEESDASPETDAELEAVRPSEAFGDLGNEVRTAAVRHLFEATQDGDDPVPFSELFEATPADTTAGFAYHLRQLLGRYVRKTEEVSESSDSEARGTSHGGYELTYAGRRAAREVAAGSYTESHDVDPIAVPDPCPVCGEPGLLASGVDNHVTVACTACERSILTLPFPPGGHRTDDADDLLSAFDRHHRHRLTAMSDGSCPECAATVEAGVERVDDPEHSEGDADDRVQLELDCPSCSCRLRCPVTLAVLENPAVVSFFHDHGLDVRERPIWNVGPEWGERLLSEEPFCVLVTCRLDDEALEAYVSRDLSVVETRRVGVE